MGSINVYDQVTTHYSKAAKEDYGDGSYGARVAASFGYSQEDLDSVPLESNLGLSCGNPFAIAHIKEGETVVDLGSGAGFDVFQAAKKVGTTGKAIGVDSSDDMLARAEQIKTKLALGENVQFVKSGITDLALQDASVDCVISNCVVNLVPEEDKHRVFEEMARVLKPGGRVAISDILARGPLPEEVKRSMELFVGCIAGASLVESYEGWLREAGFSDILIVDAKSDLNVYRHSDGTNAGCCAPPEAAKEEEKKKNGCCGSSTKASIPAQAETVKGFDDVDFNEFAGSFKIYAIKP